MQLASTWLSAWCSQSSEYLAPQSCCTTNAGVRLHTRCVDSSLKRQVQKQSPVSLRGVVLPEAIQQQAWTKQRVHGYNFLRQQQALLLSWGAMAQPYMRAGPASMALCMMLLLLAMHGTSAHGPASVAEFVQQRPALATFSSLLAACPSLSRTLEERPRTVFAPSDEVRAACIHGCEVTGDVCPPALRFTAAQQ